MPKACGISLRFAPVVTERARSWFDVVVGLLHPAQFGEMLQAVEVAADAEAAIA